MGGEGEANVHAELAAVSEALPELDLLPLQSAGKTAVILRYEQRMAKGKGESK